MKIWTAFILLMIAQATTTIDAAPDTLVRFLTGACRAPRVRSLVEFAEQEIVLPTGQYANQKWRADRLPWNRVLFEEIDSGRWIQTTGTGPTQSGKTQAFFSIPILHEVHERRNNTVIGLPDDDMGDKKWKTDLLPMIVSSPGLHSLRPDGGKGSRGGTVKGSIEFGNDAIAALMTKGASDEGKAGFTSRTLHVTEAGGFSASVETSTETDPLRQLKGRLKGFKRHQRRIIVEGTVKVKEMLPWSLRGDNDGPLISSQSLLLTPCPHCGEWISPEREDFRGHQGAETEDEAVNAGLFYCPICDAALSEEDRKVANQDIEIVHRGQTIDKSGEIVGDKPPTSTLWFRYSQWHNLLSSYGDIAAEEWEAAQTPEGTQGRDSLERALQQQTWCIPFVSELVPHEPLVAMKLRSRGVDPLPKNTVPAGTQRITLGVDIGREEGWWVAIAWQENGQRSVISWGRFEIMKVKKGRLHDYIVRALRETIAPLVETGFAGEGDGMYIPDTVWIDGGYHPEAVAEFVRSRGRVVDNRYRFCRGRGTSASQKWLKGHYSHPKRRSKTRPHVGQAWFSEVNYKRQCLEFTFDADFWKLDVQEGLRGEPDRPNGIGFWRPDKHDSHAVLTEHLCSEQFVREWKPGKGEVGEWVKSGHNHLLDCMAMASAAGNAVGVVMAEPEIEEDPVAVEQPDNFYARMLGGNHAT